MAIHHDHAPTNMNYIPFSTPKKEKMYPCFLILGETSHPYLQPSWDIISVPTETDVAKSKNLGVRSECARELQATPAILIIRFEFSWTGSQA